jgi:vancomycin resistance protein YoaR
MPSQILAELEAQTAASSAQTPPPAAKPPKEQAAEPASAPVANESPPETQAKAAPADALEMSKASAINYWQEKKDNADSFAGYLGAHLMGLNAEIGYDMAEGVKSLAETVSDPEKLKAAVNQAVESAKAVITDPKGAAISVKEAAIAFSELPAGKQADAVYKGVTGILAGAGGSLRRPAVSVSWLI